MIISKTWDNHLSVTEVLLVDWDALFHTPEHKLQYDKIISIN